MFNLLRKLRTSRRSPASHSRPPARDVRLRMEELECRALPSAMGAFGPMTNNIRHDVRDIASDTAALVTALPGNTSATTLQSAVTTLTKDLANSTSSANLLTQDLLTVVSDLSALGTSTSTTATGRVLRMERDLSQDVVDLARDLTPPGRARGEITSAAAHANRLIGLARDVQSDLKDVQSDGQALVTALAGNTSTAFTNVQNDLTAIAKDTDPSKLTSDLSTLSNDLNTLSGSLTTPVARNVRHLIRDLGSDVRDLRNDLNQVANQANRVANDLQSDLTQLTNQLGSGGATLTMDLNAALATLAADVKAGNNVSTDVSTAFAKELALIANLDASQTSISAGARASLFDIAFDLAAMNALNV
jgi:hypothetical protein